MSGRAYPARRRALASFAGALGVGLLGVAVTGLVESRLLARAWLLAAGFALVATALALARPRRVATPIGLALFFAVYGGLSAVVAVDEVFDVRADVRAVHLLRQLGIGEDPIPPPPGVASFSYALLITTVAGAAAILGSLAAVRFAGERFPDSDDRAQLARARRAARVLVVIGFVGLAAAVARFLFVELPTPDLWASMKSFWRGNAYFLLVANATVVGLGLWLAAAIRQRDSRRELVLLAALAAVFVAALLPTGQRGFALELALLVGAVLAFRHPHPVRVAALAVAVAIPLLGVTQAARNEVRETGTFGLEGVTQRLEPESWSTLYGSQLASFRWTWDVAAAREHIDSPNTFAHALLKPIPRQLLPNKVQGFGAEFTEALYPAATASEVFFAPPLVAEADYNLGPAGPVVLLFGLGLLLAFLELFAVRGAPRVLRPIWAAVVAFSGFMLLRGDFANGLVFTAGLVVPLSLASLYVGYRPRPRRDRIVIDALQVPAHFSGVGRQIQQIGAQLAGVRLPRKLEVRCAVDTVESLRDAFPAETEFRTPLRSSRPRIFRIAYQQVVAPLLDRGSILLVCPGDQSPLWGRPRVLLVVNDVRRLTDSGGPLLETFFYRFVVPRSARRAFRIATISLFSRTELERTLRGTVPPIAVAGHQLQLRSAAAPPENAGGVLVIGALRPYKGAETVIDALSLIEPEKRPSIIFVGSTEGRETELAERAEARGVSEYVEFRGWVDDTTLDALCRRAQATLNPSTYEGYGLPVAESLAYGLPTIASDIPPHREIGDEAVLYFETGDPASLAEQLRRLVSDEALRTELAEAARERARKLAASGPSWAELIVDAAAAAR